MRLKPPFPLPRVLTREQIKAFFERRRIQRNMAIGVSFFLVLFVGTEIYFPQVSLIVGLMAFMVVYFFFLTGVLVVKRWNAKIKGSDLNVLQDENKSSDLGVAVIIPAHNEATVIEASIQHFMRNTPLHYEVWVINDRSTDGTYEVLEAFRESVARVQPDWLDRLYLIHRPLEAVPGKSAVLNDAFAFTEQPVLAVFDADARIEAGFFEKMLVYLEQDDSIAAVQARKMIANANDNVLTKCQQWEYTFDAHIQWCRDLAGSAVELRGNGFLIKRGALDSVGGWNENSITDDLDLSTRLHLKGWLIRFAHRVSVEEEGITQFKALLKQRERWAEGSLRRYLDLGGSILMSSEASFRTRLDMFAYWVNFLMPILIALEILVVGTATILGQATRIHQLLALSLIPMFGVAFIPTIYNAIRRFEAPPRMEALNAAFLTGIYMTIVWFPIVFYSFGKVLFRPNAPFKWAKTEHGL